MIEPLPPPKSIDHKVRSVFAGRSRFRSTFLFDPTDVELLKNYFALFPYGLPTTYYVSRQQLVEGILKREFGHEKSKQLLYCPCQRDMLLFLMKKKRNQRIAKTMSSVPNACEPWKAYMPFVASTGSNDIVPRHRRINAYYVAARLKIPPACSDFFSNKS